MKILGIETSCDETAAAIVENGTKVLSNVVASSVDLHQKTGGIIPEVAAREQIGCIIPVVDAAMSNVKCQMSNLDALAVTVGPGLIGSLLVGVETARTLAYVWKKPVVPINHLVAHIYANWLSGLPQLPAIALVVSGGHTDLVLMKTHGKINWLGGTRDDAAGECFDKCSRLLRLGYPGGPAIENAASKLKTQNSKLKTIKLPRPMIKQKNYDFSFSGLKTAVLRQAQDKLSEAKKAALAAEIQEAIVNCLVEKTVKATKEYRVKSILLAGGVAANTLLREKLEARSSKLEVRFCVPPRNLCTDNAAMIASYASFNFKPVSWKKIKADPSLSIEEMV